MAFKNIIIMLACVALLLAFLLAMLSMYTTEFYIDSEKHIVLYRNTTYFLTLRNFSKEEYTRVENVSLCINVYRCLLYYSIAMPDMNYSFSGVLSNSTCMVLPSSKFIAFFNVIKGGDDCDTLFELRLTASISPFWYASIASLVLLITGNVFLVYAFTKHRFTS
jgi:hypothetical protein